MRKPEQVHLLKLVIHSYIITLCYKTMYPRMESFSLTRERLARLTSSAIEQPSLYWPLLE